MTEKSAKSSNASVTEQAAIAAKSPTDTPSPSLEGAVAKEDAGTEEPIRRERTSSILTQEERRQIRGEPQPVLTGPTPSVSKATETTTVETETTASTTLAASTSATATTTLSISDTNAKPGSPSDSATPSLNSKIVVAQRKPIANFRPTRQFEIRGGYLNARYSELEPQLENGASSFGLGYSQEIQGLDARLALDLFHGLDQAVTPQNIRMVVLRADLAYPLISAGPVRPFASGGLAYADYTVRSFRTVSGSDLTLREHAKGSSLGIVPALGLLFELGDAIRLDLQAEYLALLGPAEAKNLGGTSVNASIGFRF